VIGVLVSGAGTNLQALLDAGLPVSGVASNAAGVPALERAERASVPAAVFPLADFTGRPFDWTDCRELGVDVRVGSATDGLTPISMAERSLAASPVQWLALVAVAAAAIAADQLTKHIVSSRLALGRPSSTRLVVPAS